MSNRNQWPSHLMSIHSELNSITLDFNDIRSIRSRIALLIFKSLEPNQLQVYDYVDGLGECDTAELVETFGFKNNHASTILKSLYDLGLLSREQVLDASGKRYVYKCVHLR